MMPLATRRAFATVIVAATALLAGTTGCSRSFPVSVAMAQPLREQAPDLTVEVHVVGLTDREADELSKLPPRTYWESKGRGTNDPPMFAVVLGPNQPSARLPANDPIWERWSDRRATRLCVIAHYPRPLPDAADQNDPRRKTFTLTRSFAGRDRAGLQLWVTDAGLQFAENH